MLVGLDQGKCDTSGFKVCLLSDVAAGSARLPVIGTDADAALQSAHTAALVAVDLHLRRPLAVARAEDLHVQTHRLRCQHVFQVDRVVL